MSEGDLKELQDEDVDLGVRRRVEYEDEEDGTLALVIPKREGGGEIEIPLLEHARTVFERTDGSLQDNTLLAVRPLAEVGRNRPVQRSGVTTNTGIATAMLRPGYLYVFFDNHLWRELEVGPDGKLSDVDVEHYREQAEGGDTPNERDSAGEWLDNILLPAMLQGQATLHRVRLAYSEIAWSWPYITWLEANPGRLETRTTAVGHAHAVVLDMEGWLSMQTGFPAGRVADQPALRERDLGIELMLQAPDAFTADFTAPADYELCAKLKALWEQAGETERAATLALECEAGDDLLVDIRDNPGIVAVSLPDPLFTLRHALAQIHLAQHYLDGLDSLLAEKPLGHSAKLIHQALYARGGQESRQSPLAGYRRALNHSIFGEVLDLPQRANAMNVIRQQLSRIEGDFAAIASALRDYSSHHDLGVCEAYALCGDWLGVLNELSGMFADQGEHEPRVVRLRERLLFDDAMLELWEARDSSDEVASSAHDNDGSGRFRPAYMQRLSEDERELDADLAKGFGLQILGLLAKELDTEEDKQQERSILAVSNVGKVAGLVASVLGKWSQATLAAAVQARDGVEAVNLHRVMAAVGKHAPLVDGSLRGELQVKMRGEVDLRRYSIIGVHGEDIVNGLTQADRQGGPMNAQNDYVFDPETHTRREVLYADVIDDHGQRVASTSPRRMAEESDAAIRKVASAVLVYVLPIDHPAAKKFGALRFATVAGQARVVADGPALSSVLVVMALYNLGVEIASSHKALRDDSFTGLNMLKGGSALTDLTAASMKLHTALYPEAYAESGQTRSARFIQRPLFELKTLPKLGPWIAGRLEAQGASSIVRVLGAMNFTAGVLAVGVSGWELRNALTRGDEGAIAGHSVAMMGGALFLGARLLHGLLLIPGWGWAMLGLGLAIAGTTYAFANQDTPFERLLKQGPFGTHPNSEFAASTDAGYHAQLLTLLSPIEISAQAFQSLPHEEKVALMGTLSPSDEAAPRPTDYVITVSTPLISRFRASGERLKLVAQELEFTLDQGRRSMDSLTPRYRLSQTRELIDVHKRLVLPQQSAVRFLFRRTWATMSRSSYLGGLLQDIHTSHLRIGVQAQLETELGMMWLPTPVVPQYRPYQPQDRRLPERSLGAMDVEDERMPYWYIKEVRV